MNRQEAKLILQAYRPGGQDAADPMFAEALALAQRDPELQKWLAQEQVLDSLVQARLHQAVPIPLGLKTRLLAQRKTVRPVVWWRTPFWLLTAAAVVVLMTALTTVLFKPSSRPEFAELRQVMVQNSLQMGDHASHMAADMSQVQSWLKTQNAPADFAMPASLHDAMLKGCKVLDWHGRKVTMLCLGAGGKHMDLFVIDCTHFRDFKPTDSVQFAKADGVTTAVWCNGDKTFFLAGHMDETDLQKIL